MTQKQLVELVENGQIDVQMDTIDQVEDFLLGWDFNGFLDYDWHERDEKAESDRYYSVMIRRNQEEEKPEDDRYYVEVQAFELDSLWMGDGEYSQNVSYSELMEIIG